MGCSSDESIDWIREFKQQQRIRLARLIPVPARAVDFLAQNQAPDRAFELSSDTSPESTPKSSHQAEKLTNKHEIILIESGENTPISKSTKPRAPKKKTHTPKDDALDALEDVHEDTKAKPAASLVSSLPLVFPDKVQRLKALVECDGDSIDLSGDVGAVGRIIVSNASSGNHELFLDLKGTIYKSTIVPSRTFCIVSVGQSEAKIEAVMNDFIRLEAKSNLFEAETMIEGTLDGFSFDSDEEGEKASKAFLQQGDPNNDNEVQGNKRGRGKTEKSMGTPSKKKKASAKTPKKAARKSQVAKRTRKSKK